MSLEVSDEYAEELVNEHSRELITEKLQDFRLEVNQAIDEEKEIPEDVPSSESKDIFSIRRKVQNFDMKKYPDKTIASRVCNSFNDSVLPHFRQILTTNLSDRNRSPFSAIEILWPWN